MNVESVADVSELHNATTCRFDESRLSKSSCLDLTHGGLMPSPSQQGEWAGKCYQIRPALEPLIVPINQQQRGHPFNSPPNTMLRYFLRRGPCRVENGGRILVGWWESRLWSEGTKFRSSNPSLHASLGSKPIYEHQFTVIHSDPEDGGSTYFRADAALSYMNTHTLYSLRPGNSWIGVWVGPRTSADAVANRKVSCSCRELNHHSSAIKTLLWPRHSSDG